MGSPEEVIKWDPTPPEDPTPEEWLHWANQLHLAQAFGIVVSELGEGRLVAVVSDPPKPLNPNGSVHGGIQLAIADHCLGVVAVTRMPPRHLPVSASVHASFHRPAMPPLTVRGRVLSAGRTLVHTEIELLDDKGRLCTSTYGAMVALPSEAVTTNTERPGR
jgi:uncharacterized protein (TIGR00369 family)